MVFKIYQEARKQSELKNFLSYEIVFYFTRSFTAIALCHTNVMKVAKFANHQENRDYFVLVETTLKKKEKKTTTVEPNKEICHTCDCFFQKILPI